MRIEHGIQPECVLEGNVGELRRIAWSHDGRTLASASSEHAIYLWDWVSARQIQTLRGHNSTVYSVAWSPDDLLLASGSKDTTIRIWESHSGTLLKTLTEHELPVNSISWSPDGRLLAAGSTDSSISVWDCQTFRLRNRSRGHLSPVESVAWSPDGKLLASAADDGTVRLWNPETGAQVLCFQEHQSLVIGLAWSPDGRFLASGSFDNAVRLFDPKVGTTLAELEGHTNHVTEVAISFDSRVVASFSWDGTIRLWDAMNYQPLAVIPESTGLRFHCGLSFHPTQPLLAAVVGGLSKIHVWRLDWEALLVETRTNEAVQFTSAKVVIVGDTGVGKTGLSLVLAGQPFEPTESSHAARVFLLNREVDAISREYPQIRETFLWDFAGQPGYRVFHQLHLSNVSVALVLFDARNEVDPFAGVSYWARALDNASRSNTLIKILVSTRVDRGGIEVSKDRLQEFVARFGFAGFFETSAKRGDGIDILLQAVRSAIKWDNLPITTTPPSFHEIRREIIETKRTGRVLESRGDLLKDIETKKLQRRTSDLGAGLDICLERLEAAGLARKLAFGDLVLLQPEMLDSYCAWLAQAARDEPEGLGFISEHRALSGDFKMDFDRPLRDRRSDELIILAATVREVVERGVALLEQTMAGSMLVFPSELCIESPEYGQSADPAFTFVFQGPVRTIYATLAITLLNSFVFEKDALFRNTALFRGPRRQLCGFVVSYADAKDETRGSLAVFFAPLVDGSVKLLFLRFIQQHLQRAAWAGTLEGHRVYIHCGELISPSVIRKRKEQRRDYVVCGVCEERIPVDADLYDGVTQSDPAVEEMVNQARSEKERQERLAVLPISEQCGSFHLFFSYNHEDKIEVQKLAEILRFDWGIIPWVDDEQIHAGQNFVETLERILTMVPVAAVVVGRHPLGKWQRKEYNALLERAVRTGETEQNHQLHLIPVLLPSAPVNLELPLWLRTVIPVDFRRSSLDDRELMQGFVRSILNKTSS